MAGTFVPTIDCAKFQNAANLVCKVVKRSGSGGLHLYWSFLKITSQKAPQVSPIYKYIKDIINQHHISAHQQIKGLNGLHVYVVPVSLNYTSPANAIACTRTYIPQ